MPLAEAPAGVAVEGAARAGAPASSWEDLPDLADVSADESECEFGYDGPTAVPDGPGGLGRVGVQPFKPDGDGAWVNGGFLVLSPRIFDYLSGDETSLEIDALPKIAEAGKLGAYKHSGFWQPVDTIRDLQRLEEAISKGALPWA